MHGPISLFRTSRQYASLYPVPAQPRWSISHVKHILECGLEVDDNALCLARGTGKEMAQRKEGAVNDEALEPRRV